MILNKYDIIRCPIHKNVVIIDQKIREIIDTAEVQRLRKINQLGLGSYLYPSATHTRFAHSLGAYEIMRKLLYEYVVNDFSEEEKNLLLCSALLHDVGHGPLSHTFELISGMSHEEWTKKIILSPETDLNKTIIKNYGSEFPNKIIQLLSKTYPNKACCKLISSELDVDRMDYLLRDSYYTSTGYGDINIDWILRCFKIQDNDLFIKIKGIPAIENFLLSRYFSYKQIYYHPKCLASEKHILSIINRFKDLKKTNYKFKQKYFLLDLIVNSKNITLNEYLEFDDYILFKELESLKNEADKIINDLVNSFYKHNFLVPEKYDKTKYENLKKILVEKYQEDYHYFLCLFNSSIPIYKKSNNKNEGIWIFKDDKKTQIHQYSKIIKSLIAEPYVEKYMFYMLGEIND